MKNGVFWDVTPCLFEFYISIGKAFQSVDVKGTFRRKMLLSFQILSSPRIYQISYNSYLYMLNMTPYSP
jgi:hypothetical protein